MQTTLLRLLPTPLRRSATAAHVALAAQFLRFGAVGFVGLAIDTATVYATRRQIGPYAAGLLSYLVAASGNWLLHRIWTFKGYGSGPLHRQWAMFMVTNFAGFLLNRGAYVALIAFVPAAAEQPVIATTAGAVAGLFINFSLTRRLVFR